MVSEHDTKACKILRVIEMISMSRVFKATIIHKGGQFMHKFDWLLQQIYLTLNGDDELRNDGENLSTALFEHVKDTLNGQESVWVLLFTNTLEENWKVMVVVKLLNFNLPVDSVLRSMLNSNWEISTVIEATERTGRNGAFVESTSSWLLWCRLLLGLEKADSAATETLALLYGCYY